MRRGKLASGAPSGSVRRRAHFCIGLFVPAERPQVFFFFFFFFFFTGFCSFEVRR
jgi:hypothetical protein